MDLIVSFSVTQLLPVDVAQSKFGDFLRSDEKILSAHTHTRDKIIFTDRQLICFDVQGITGSKKNRAFSHIQKSSKL